MNKSDVDIIKPFFILGCVRSGTTFLRNVLRLHPNLASPEETHFYRWTDPYGTPALNQMLSNNKVLKKHRQIDKITEEEFHKILLESQDRAELYSKYMALYIKKNKPKASRWFDKTPQNIFGIHLISQEFEQSKFIILVRHPLDVVGSLRVGKVMKIQNLKAATNYWLESLRVAMSFEALSNNRVRIVRYEDLIDDFEQQIRQILLFLDEELEQDIFCEVEVIKPNRDTGLFNQKELDYINSRCEKLMSTYGYEMY